MAKSSSARIAGHKAPTTRGPEGRAHPFERIGHRNQPGGPLQRAGSTLTGYMIPLTKSGQPEKKPFHRIAAFEDQRVARRQHSQPDKGQHG